MINVKDVRNIFKEKLANEEFVIDKNGGKVIEILSESVNFNDDDIIFGTLNLEYAKKELIWYNSMSLNVYDIPKTPLIFLVMINPNVFSNH